jgi:bacterioferritin
MQFTKEQFISELNKDLSLEYSAAIQYLQHAAVIDGPGYTTFIEELLTHADEEFGHAKKIADHLNFLGAIPTIDVGERKISSESVEMLQQDLEGENTAISRYKERIAQARELKDFGSEKILLEILADEESHANDLETILAIKKVRQQI